MLESEREMADVSVIRETAGGVVRDDFVRESAKPQEEIKEVPVRKRVRKVESRLWLDTGDIEEAMSLWNSDYEAFATDQKALGRQRKIVALTPH